VLSETKTNSKLAHKLPQDSYNIFKEAGIPATGYHIFKWGLVIGVRKDIQISQQMDALHRALQGRVIALDIIVPSLCGHGFLHRLMGAYAPWDPGADPITKQFWPELTHICITARNGWTLAGDLNATISTSERSSGGSEARNQYRSFLMLTDAIDLWNKVPDRSRLHDWTCQGHRSEEGGSIIDRVASSQTSYMESEISAAKQQIDFVPFTDHRAIVARLTLKHLHSTKRAHFNTPGVGHTLAQPRIRYPLKKENYWFKYFRDEVDKKISTAALTDTPVIDDDTFLHRYNALTTILIKKQ
jgi:hypothetical protein